MTQDFEIIGPIEAIEEIEEDETEIPDNTNRFAVCIRPTSDIDLLTVYPVINDPDAEEDEMLRVIDNSGYDYLYPAASFVALTLPEADAQTLIRVMRDPAATLR